jgi:hypothetical protein
MALVLAAARVTHGSGQEENMAAHRAAPAPPPLLVATDAYVRPAVKGFAGGLPEATADAYSTPKAVRFVGAHDRTYITYGNTRTDPMITFYDHREKRWAAPVNAGQSTRPGDAHSNAALTVDGDGRLYLVYGGHHTGHVLRRSARPEDISAWEPEQPLSAKATYSNVGFVADTLYWFGRQEWGEWGWMACRDGGRSRSPFQIVFRPYARPDGTHTAYAVMHIAPGKAGPTMHLFWMMYGANRWYNMYYAVSHDLGQTWQTTRGQPLRTPIAYAEGELVYEGDTHGWQNQIVVDGAGRPGLLFVTGGAEIVSRNAALFAYWTGKTWAVSKICDAASMYNFGCAQVEGVGRFRVYFAGGRWNGGEIGEWRTADGGRRWKHTRDLTRDSPVPNAFPRAVVNAHPELQIVWCAGDRPPGKVYAWGEASSR